MSVLRSKDNTAYLVAVLAITGVVAGALLAIFYGWINPIVTERRMAEVMSVGLKGIFPEAESFKEVTLGSMPNGVEPPVYEVYDGAGKRLGVWFSGASNGYGGPIKMAIGVNPDDATLVGIRILEHSETPGLGSKIEEENFWGQFSGKALSDAFSVGGDVSGVSGATVSSRAVTNGAANLSRGVLAAMGVEVDAPAADAAAHGAGGGSAIDSALAAKIKEVVPGQPEFKPMVWQVTGDDKTYVAIQTEAEGEMGPVAVVTVVDPETKRIVGLRVTSHGETPGLGSMIEDDPSFAEQFVGKKSGDLVLGNGIDAITMATHSSQAVVDAARKALKVVENL